MTIKQVQNILLQVYSKQTCYPSLQKSWSKLNPTLGQCVPTALLVQHYFGGVIYKLDDFNHYYNVINGKIVDITKEQFANALDYSLGYAKEPNLQHADSLKRFNLLKAKVEKYLKQNKL